MLKALTITPNTSPLDALELPEGRLAMGNIVVSFSPENVVEAAELVVEKGGADKPFVSQAGIIAYAGNKLGWGVGEGYATA